MIKRIILASLWTLMMLSAFFIAYKSVYYVYGAPDKFPLTPDAGEAFAFRLHAFGGLLALVLGPLQFLSGIRLNLPALHRWIGRGYVLAVAIGVAGAFMLAMSPQGGAVNQFSFTALAVLWLTATGMALIQVLRGNYVSHRRWMVRSYALTFAAVTLRIGIPVLIGGVGMDYAEAYQTVAWASWTLNLIIAEWIIVPQTVGVLKRT